VTKEKPFEIIILRQKWWICTGWIEI